MKLLKRIQKRPTQKIQYGYAFFAIFSGLLMSTSLVLKADATSSAELRNQLTAIQQQIDASKAKATELAGQADSLKRTIAGLDVQITQASSEIDLTTTKIAILEDKLTKATAELERQKGLLKANMRALYKKAGASSVELLIGSDSFSDYINGQEYLDRLKISIQQSAEQVVEIKKQIQSEKDEQQTLLKTEEDQKRTLDATKASRQALLDQTQNDEVRYTALVQEQISKQAEVNKQLIAQIQLETGNGTSGGYPYVNWPFSMVGFGCTAGDGPDRWGYCTRQCVSYAAWAVERSGRHAPYGYGNAKDWVYASQRDGIPGGSTPKTGDVAIYTGGIWGHAQYVEAVYGDGTMRISQFNIMLDGKYSEATVSSSRTGWYYIHFP
jgi:peptidoglycan hydrolase CwlO-like protein